MRRFSHLSARRSLTLCMLLLMSLIHGKVHEITIVMGAVPTPLSELLSLIDIIDPYIEESVTKTIEETLTQYLVTATPAAVESTLVPSLLILPSNFIRIANYLAIAVKHTKRESVKLFEEEQGRSSRYFRNFLLFCLSSSILMVLSFGSGFLLRFSSISKCCSAPALIESDSEECSAELEECPAELAVMDHEAVQEVEIIQSLKVVDTHKDVLVVEMSSIEMDQGYQCLQSINKQLISLNTMKDKWEDQLTEKNIKLETLSLALNTALADKFDARSQVKSQQDAIDKLTERLRRRCRMRNIDVDLNECSTGSSGWDSQEEGQNLEVRLIPNRTPNSNLSNLKLNPSYGSIDTLGSSRPLSPRKSSRTSPRDSSPKSNSSPWPMRQLSIMTNDSTDDHQGLTSPMSLFDDGETAEDIDYSHAMRGIKQKLAADLSSVTSSLHVTPEKFKNNVSYRRTSESVKSPVNGIHTLLGLQDDVEGLESMRNEINNAVDQSTASISVKESEVSAFPKEDLLYKSNVNNVHVEEEEEEEELRNNFQPAKLFTFAPLTVLAMSAHTDRESPATTVDSVVYTSESVSSASAAYTEDDVIRLSNELDAKIQELIASKMDNAHSASLLDHAHLRISLLNNQLRSYCKNKSGPLFDVKKCGGHTPSKLPRPVKRSTPGTPNSVMHMMSP